MISERRGPDPIIEVVEQPAAFVTAADLGPNVDAGAATMAIAAAIAAIAAPGGWLGRSLGNQALRWTWNSWPCRLPYGPVIDIVEIKYFTPDGAEATLSPSAYRLLGDQLIGVWPAVASRPDAVRVVYRAGYDTVPANAKYAVILAAKDILTLKDVEAAVTSETVDGIGSLRYGESAANSNVVNARVKALLAPLRVFI